MNSAESMLGKLTGGDLLKYLHEASRSQEVSRYPVRVRTWGRLGISAAYNVIPRPEVISDFLQNEIGLKPDKLHKTQVHIIGEKPWKIPDVEKSNIFPPDANKRKDYIHSDYAWFSVDETTDEHFLVIAAYRVWEGLKGDRQRLVEWRKRKRRTQKSWELLDKKTIHINLTEELRATFEAVSDMEAEQFLANLISSAGRNELIDKVVHEVVHSDKHRRADRIRLSKSRFSRSLDKQEEAEAEKKAEEITDSGKWNHMLDFRVNPRTPRVRRTAVRV